LFIKANNSLTWPALRRESAGGRSVPTCFYPVRFSTGTFTPSSLL